MIETVQGANLLALTDSEHSCSADLTLAPGGWSSIFECYYFGVLNLSVGTALEAVRLHRKPPEV